MCFFRILKSKWQKNPKCFLFQKLRRRGSLYVINFYICYSVIKKVKNANILQNLNMGEKWLIKQHHDLDTEILWPC